MILLLAFAIVALVTAENCIQHRERVNSGGLIGAYVPQCNADGSYKSTQCHGSTGYCWCAFKDTGSKLLGTEARSKPTTTDCKSKCVVQRHQALTQTKLGLLGVMVPSCEVNGRYSKVQCHGHLNMCWCADQDAGTPIEGTQKIMSNGVKPQC